MLHEDYKQLLALEALGGLDAEGRRALEEHLPSCAECRTELRELGDAAAALVYTVAPVAPPAELRASLMARVRASAPAESFAAPPRVAPDPSEALDSSRTTPERRGAAAGGDARGLVRGLSLWQLLKWRPALGLGAAFAAAAVVLLGSTSVALWGRNQSLTAEVTRLYDTLRATEGELSAQREQLASARNVSDLLAAPGVRFAELAGKKPAPGAHAMLAYDHSTGRAVIMAAGLPPCPAGHAYQLWLINDNKPQPGGTFRTDAAGQAHMTDRLPAGVGSPTFAVTLEREGGVPAPEGDIYLLGSSS